MEDHYQVNVTVSTAEEGARLSRSLVERRLAASGQVSGPISSTYWWRGTSRPPRSGSVSSRRRARGSMAS